MVRVPTHPAVEAHRPEELEPFRRELTGYCYRMLGSGFEAEDAVQETMVRAWTHLESFEQRASLRSWLYRIATNVCLDMLRSRQRRAQPMEMGPSSTADTQLGAPLPEQVWIQPVAESRVLPPDADPANLVEARETIRLAFVAALQHLPPRQRAVLILREVLRWSAAEVAELLDTSVASVNSALQRARATLAERSRDEAVADVASEHEDLLARYLDAFERYDVSSLVTLLHQDATFTMPPFSLWLRGPDQVEAWMLGQGIVCKDARLLATRANGCPAVALYHPSPDGKAQLPWAIQVLEVDGDRIAAVHNFLTPALFPLFGLPERLPNR